MLNPSIEQLLQKVDSKYSLVVGAAKRARQLSAVDQKPLIKSAKSNKCVGIALEEIQAGNIVVQKSTERSDT
jgi:DNA-directed RNA polymerase subunit omega